MNRPEKTSEPSMEDILASIRRIISDEDRVEAEANSKSPHSQAKASDRTPLRDVAESAKSQSGPSRTGSEPAQSGEGDVFNLTQELVFLREPQPDPVATASTEPLLQAPVAAKPMAEAKEPPRLNDSVLGAVRLSRAPENEPFEHPLLKLRAEQAEKQRQEQQVAKALDMQAFAPPSQRVVWSLREPSAIVPPPTGHGLATPQFAARLGAHNADQSPSKVTAQISPTPLTGKTTAPTHQAPATPSSQGFAAKSWDEDIQLPVPEDGPVSLLRQPQFSKGPARSEHEDFGLQPSKNVIDPHRVEREIQHAQQPAAPTQHLEPQDGAADEGGDVSALAQTLAKTAMLSMDDEELVEAEQFDFDGLDAEQRTSVSEVFADILTSKAEVHAEPESNAATSKSDAASLLPDFATFPPKDDRRLEALEAEPGKGGETPRAEPRSPKSASTQSFRAATADTQAASANTDQKLSAPPENRAEPVIYSRAVQPMAAPVVQAQFVGQTPSQTSVAVTTSRTLEDSVREMLRPMLVSWLNEHMPRILESAIREEIASRGLGFGTKPDPHKS